MKYGAREPCNDNHGDWGFIPSSLNLVVVNVPQPAGISAEGDKLEAFNRLLTEHPPVFCADWMYGGNTLLFYGAGAQVSVDDHGTLNGVVCRLWYLLRTPQSMTATLIGYARCSTDKQDLTAQRQALAELGVAPDRIYMDKGLTGTNRARPGLDQAMAAVRKGDTLVVPKLDRLARSVPDARHIADQLQAKGVKLALGRNIHDPSDPMGKMFFNILATFAEFEADLIRMRTREGMAIARAKGKLRGKQPKLSEKQQKELCRMHATGHYSIGDLAEVFAVSRPTVYRTLSRAAASS